MLALWFRAPPGLEGANLGDFDGARINGAWTIYIGDGAGSQAFSVLDQRALRVEVDRVLLQGAAPVFVLALGPMSRQRRH